MEEGKWWILGCWVSLRSKDSCLGSSDHGMCVDSSLRNCDIWWSYTRWKKKSAFCEDVAVKRSTCSRSWHWRNWIYRWVTLRNSKLKTKERRCRSGWGSRCCSWSLVIGKFRFIKNDMSWNINALSKRIQASIPLMLNTVPKQHTRFTFAFQFGRYIRFEPWETATTKKFQSWIIWRQMKQKFPRWLKKTRDRKLVDQIDSSGEGLNPKLMRYLRLN